MRLLRNLWALPLGIALITAAVLIYLLGSTCRGCGRWRPNHSPCPCGKEPTP